MAEQTENRFTEALQKESKGTAFYLRTGNGTRLLPVDEALQYVRHRWGKTA